MLVVMEISEIATEQLEAEPVAHAAWEAVGMARMLAVLAEFDRREAWKTWECRSPQHWLSWKCGLGHVAASERLRVARVLPDLPIISAALAGGLLSWSKVRELTRVATPETERSLVDIAMSGTASHVARLVTAMRRVTRAQAVRQLADREFRWATNEDGSVSITVRLPADRAMPVIRAVEQATILRKDVPRSQTAADAFVDVVCGDAGSRRAERPRPEVIVHIEGDQARFENGPSISTEVAACLTCDAPVTTVADTADGPVVVDKRRGPTRSQRRWLGLRHPTCQFPGCDHRGSFEVHHVVEHRHGGTSRLSNLARLCWFHHRVVHLHGLQMTLHRDRTLDVRFPAGNPVDRSIPSTAFLVAPPERPDEIGGRWYGDRLDLDHALAAFGLGG